MSRRRGEFEHRTTIFEGAFRAWSHLGGLDPEELESKSSSDLDPLTNPIINDARLTNKQQMHNDHVTTDGSARREYPYEPLPRAGLAHPFVQVREFFLIYYSICQASNIAMYLKPQHARSNFRIFYVLCRRF
jgi:hypothetical protein